MASISVVSIAASSLNRLVVRRIGLAPLGSPVMVDQAPPCDRERPASEVGVVAFEVSDAPRDRLPDVRCDVVGEVAVPAAQVAQEARLEVVEQDRNRPLLARLRLVEDRAESRCCATRVSSTLDADGFIAIPYPA